MAKILYKKTLNNLKPWKHKQNHSDNETIVINHIHYSLLHYSLSVFNLTTYDVIYDSKSASLSLEEFVCVSRLFDLT